MEHWIAEVMDAYGYLGIFLLIALENVFPPIPSEVILTFGGFMTTSTDLTVPGVIAFATVGSIVGAVILYGIGRVLSAERLESIVAKYGKVLRLKPEDIRKADAWFDKYGPWAVFFGRLVPLVRSLISIPAGMSGMRILPFLLLTTIGSVIWNTALVCVGAAVGDSWDTIVGYMDIYSNIVYAGLALAFLAAAIWFVRKRLVKKTD
ncbi:MAG TPA: DedA family protein [Paenibacillus sp.]|nr:DedA family protein [Paenibacillus sp.]